MPILTLQEIEKLNHDVFRYKLQKAADYTFVPGQATDVAIVREGWREEKRPFTFTSLPGDDHLEFVIKAYRDHDGVTQKMPDLLLGDQLEVGDPWGAIEYKGSGVFIAGGAGLTPFIAIFRMLKNEGSADQNSLFFANKTKGDIFLKEELEGSTNLHTRHILSEEKLPEFEYGRIDKAYLEKNISDFDQRFYVCGPPEMVEDVTAALKELGAKTDGLVFEE